MIIGNEKQRSFLVQLLKDLRQGTILVAGPEAVGKFTFLKEFLQESSEIEKVFLRSDEKILKIESARLLVSLGLLRTSRRIIIIDEAHKFQYQAQNTLLKTLEETNSNTIFVLITHQLNKILPTIRSRSLIVKFSFVPEKEIIEFFKDKGYSLTEIEFALKFYPGQPGKILNFLAQKKKIELFQRFLQASTSEKLKLIDDLKENFSFQEFLEYYLLWLRNNLKENNISSSYIKNILNIYADADDNLNFEIQLANLILQNG